MTRPQLTALIRKHNGWWDGDTARFPTPHNKDQFLKELNEKDPQP